MEILAGAIIGMIIATTGIGAGILTAPLLIVVFGQPPAESVGTVLVFSTAIKVFATALYARRGVVNRRVLAWLLAGGVPGAFAGALLLNRARSAQLSSVVLLLVGAAVVVTAAGTLLRPGARGGDVRPRLLAWLAAPIGLQVGFSSSGAGALGTVLLFRLTTLTPLEVVGTDLAFGLALSAAGGGLHLLFGNVLAPTLWKLLIGGLVGVPLGARLAGALHPRALRLAVLVWAVVLGLWLCQRGVAQLVS